VGDAVDRRSLRGTWRAALAALLLAAPAKAAPAPDATASAGPWMLSLEGTPRRCRVMLSAEAAGVGQAVRFPAGCRRALPILNGVAGWLAENGAVRLLGADAQPLLDFAGAPDAEGAYRARSAGGESYAFAVETAQNGFDAPVRVAHASLTAPDAALLPPPARLAPGVLAPGVYTLDRFVEKDTCRLRLVSGADETRTVEMLEGCRDGGLSVFDPVGWRFLDGRLTLVARKGHTVDLIAVGDGRWRRDPEVGTTFVLRRVEN
jgi:hypothetical protein